MSNVLDFQEWKVRVKLERLRRSHLIQKLFTPEQSRFTLKGWVHPIEEEGKMPVYKIEELKEDLDVAWLLDGQEAVLERLYSFYENEDIDPDMYEELFMSSEALGMLPPNSPMIPE